ncbi:ABC transporter substrate-binding protein [Macrococcoides bohemicum]|nr:ABC transporter substrate-binding protein [Macrococcus bohemicus]
MDKRLLYLEKYITDNIEDVTLAEYLNISNRQLSRLLKQWADEGYIKYTPAVGRGRKAEITFITDVEKELFYYAMKHHKNMTLQEINDFLELPWDDESKEVIVKKLKESFKQEDSSGNMVVDFVYSIPYTIHPHISQDIISFQVITQTNNTLYKLDKDNKILNEIVKYDEWKEQTLHIYLHKDIYFNDKTKLTAQHVYDSLYALMFDSNYRIYFGNVNKITIIDKYYLTIELCERTDHVKYLLAEPFASIFKVKNGELQGTGPYYLSFKDENEIKLSLNPYYKRVVLIEEILLIKNRKRFLEYISSNKYDKSLSKRVYIGNDMLVFNPNTTFSLEERHVIIEAMLYVLYEDNINNWKNFNWLLDEPQSRGDISNISRPVRMLVDQYNAEIMEKVRDELNKTGYYIELIYTEHHNYLSTSLKEYDVDIVWMSEAYNQKQPFMLYDLLLHCKFKDWYIDDPNCIEFIKNYRYENFDQLENIAKTILQSFEDRYLFANVLLKQKVFFYPSVVKYVDEDKYGYLDFGNAILK